MKTVRVFTFCLIFSFAPLLAGAQLRVGSGSGIAADLKKIIEDYPNGYANLMGEQIRQDPQSADYHCRVAFRESESCHFTRYSGSRPVLSWEAVILTTESFTEAEKKFRQVFQQVNNQSVRLADGRQLRLKGSYEKPGEAGDFHSVMLSDAEPSGPLSRLRLEIALQPLEPLSWQVKLLLYDHQRDDRERGRSVER